MITKKLTLSADGDVIREAKKLAKSRHTTVSRIFSRLLRAMTHPDKPGTELGPLTEEMTGIVELQRGEVYTNVLEQALAERYEPTR